jgi:hypothetical protein
MFLFNDAISTLGLVELPLKGKRFTWTNKQRSPLLERLDWFFTSPSWTLSYPNTFVTPLIMETSNHTPCAISISNAIPKHHIFKLRIIGSITLISSILFSKVGLCLLINLIQLRLSLPNLKGLEWL